MINLDWLNLRPFNGDIKHGFEELVCQLARAEKIEGKVKFIRVAAPDGGVEAYCILSNGDEYGWQAKFFHSMNSSQWKQLDKSFKTAFEKRPNLKRYYICIPLDREDPSDKKKQWFMQKWNAQVKNWESYAQSMGRSIEFEYWGSFEIFDRLTRPENEGKRNYWFGKEEFSEEWFSQHLVENIRNLGNRYSPKLNFDLPIAKIFEGLARDTNFQKQFRLYYEDLIKKFNKAIPNTLNSRSEFIEVADNFGKFRAYCDAIDFIELGTINQNLLTKSAELILEAVKRLIDILISLDLEEKKEKEITPPNSSTSSKYSWQIEYLRSFRYSMSDFIEFINGTVISLFNKPFLLLTGEAGIGKSHLLADVAIKRLERNQFTILLLGQHFINEELWSQIKKMLHLNCERNTFLSALNSKAESLQERILIFIDGLDENEGKKFWKNYISGFIEAIKRYPNLGVVISVRTSYEDAIIPVTIKENKEITKIVHYGFSSNEYESMVVYFDYYEIILPNVPLLNPEFRNPLFLKLFCEGLKNKKLHDIPDGYEGISAILNFYLEAINDKLSEKYDILKEINIVQK